MIVVLYSLELPSQITGRRHNYPSGKWDWYRYNFPRVEVDIACSAHAYFAYDAVHMPDAHVVLG